MTDIVYKKKVSNGDTMHGFRMSNEYKSKLKKLQENGVHIGKTIRPWLYQWIDDMMKEIGKKP